MVDLKRTKSEELVYAELIAELDQLEHWQKVSSLKLNTIPEQWAEIARDAKRRQKKARATVSLDTDVLKFYRAFGPGYQTRINAILRAWMLAVQSRELESPGSRDWKGDAV